jgi:hypothetical protein
MKWPPGRKWVVGYLAHYQKMNCVFLFSSAIVVWLAVTVRIKPHAKSAKGTKDGTSGAISCPE